MTEAEFQTAIDMLLHGDKEGLRHIYEAYVRFIYGIVYDNLKNRTDAEDITSEFFIKLIRIADTYKKGSSHRAWMAVIAKNMCIDLLRRKGHEVYESCDTGEQDTGLNIMDSGQNEQVWNSHVENAAILTRDMNQALAGLEAQEREIIDMKLTGQLKFREIAHILGQPIGTVTWIYNQGIKKIRRYLANYER